MADCGIHASDRRPQVAVAVFVVKGSSVLLGRRLSIIGCGTFALPGGRLEFAPALMTEELASQPARGETLEDCARREVKEETGLEVGLVELQTVVNTVARNGPDPSHFVTFIMRAVPTNSGQEPVNLEPDKCEGWSWYEWAWLPRPLFGPLDDLLRGGFDLFTPFRPIHNFIT